MAKAARFFETLKMQEGASLRKRVVEIEIEHA